MPYDTEPVNRDKKERGRGMEGGRRERERERREYAR
jgi:hypothetical protein